MYIAILGRQPALGMAELERLYGGDKTAWLSESSAKITSDHFDFEQLGGSRKAGKIITEFPNLPWRSLSKKIVQYYRDEWSQLDHKITLGISTYDFHVSPYDIQRLGLDLKKVAHASGGSLRLIPNHEPALSTATSHHNKLGLSPNKIELLIIKAANDRIILAESVGSQNITAIAARDQARPKTDAFVGMLPPKLARMMVNMATGLLSTEMQPLSTEGSASPVEVGASKAAASGPTVPSGDKGRSSEPAARATSRFTVLDPFCGTGVILQEASLLGFRAYGTDVSEKMIDYSTINLDWLAQRYGHLIAPQIELGDAMKHTWKVPIHAVASETYLGQPFSAPPSHEKLLAVRDNCDHIISVFLQNISRQIATGTPLCLAVPAWRDALGGVTYLSLIDNLDKLGFKRIALDNVRNDQLLYFRPEQVVARQLLLLETI